MKVVSYLNTTSLYNMKVSYSLKNINNFGSRSGRKLNVNNDGKTTKWIWNVSRYGTVCAYSNTGLKVVASAGVPDYTRSVWKGNADAAVTPATVLSVLRSALNAWESKTSLAV